MIANKPIDFILALVPDLSDREREEVLKACGSASICQAKGHKYKPLDKREITSWLGFKRAISRVYCERCGIIRTY